jgi:hypothetical protein
MDAGKGDPHVQQIFEVLGNERPFHRLGKFLVG